MKHPNPAFEIDYRHDRRAHRHRCRCCRRVINDGERVVMTRLKGKSWAIHVSPCADLQYGSSAFVWRDAMIAWGNAHLRKLGYGISFTALELARG